MDELQPDLWVLVRQSDAQAHGGWTVRDASDRASALRHYVQNMLIAHGATTVQALPGSSALSLSEHSAEFVAQLRQLHVLNERDLARMAGELEQASGNNSSGAAGQASDEAIRCLLEQVDRQLTALRQPRHVETLRDVLAELASLLRERPGGRARFFDCRTLSSRMPVPESLDADFSGVDGSDVTDDDLWLVPVRRI